MAMCGWLRRCACPCVAPYGTCLRQASKHDGPHPHLFNVGWRVEGITLVAAAPQLCCQ